MVYNGPFQFDDFEGYARILIKTILPNNTIQKLIIFGKSFMPSILNYGSFQGKDYTCFN